MLVCISILAADQWLPRSSCQSHDHSQPGRIYKWPNSSNSTNTLIIPASCYSWHNSTMSFDATRRVSRRDLCLLTGCHMRPPFPNDSMPPGSEPMTSDLPKVSLTRLGQIARGSGTLPLSEATCSGNRTRGAIDRGRFDGRTISKAPASRYATMGLMRALFSL